MSRKWWGYLHSNGSIQLKYWTGDHGDYTTDCDNNNFVVKVIKPFEAPNRKEALTIITRELLFNTSDKE